MKTSSRVITVHDTAHRGAFHLLLEQFEVMKRCAIPFARRRSTWQDNSGKPAMARGEEWFVAARADPQCATPASAVQKMNGARKKQQGRREFEVGVDEPASRW
jgi:hypothetical protein